MMSLIFFESELAYEMIKYQSGWCLEPLVGSERDEIDETSPV